MLLKHSKGISSPLSGSGPEKFGMLVNVAGRGAGISSQPSQTPPAGSASTPHLS